MYINAAEPSAGVMVMIISEPDGSLSNFTIPVSLTDTAGSLTLNPYAPETGTAPSISIWKNAPANAVYGKPESGVKVYGLMVLTVSPVMKCICSGGNSTLFGGPKIITG
ncbi:hypothetical protein ACWNMU_09795 [Escherichia fergusonii]